MEQVHPDSAFRDHATAMLTKASAAQTAIALNHDVYNALAALDLSKADAATKYYVQRQLLEFRLAGVDKDDATRARLKKLNDQATEQQSMFDRNISDGKKVVEADPSELDGLPQDYIDRHKPDAERKNPHHHRLSRCASGLLFREKRFAAPPPVVRLQYPRLSQRIRKSSPICMKTRYEIANSSRLSLMGRLQRRR